MQEKFYCNSVWEEEFRNHFEILEGSHDQSVIKD